MERNVLYPPGAPRCTRACTNTRNTEEFSVAVITPFREPYIVTIIISIETTQERLSRDPALGYFAGWLTRKPTLHG